MSSKMARSKDRSRKKREEKERRRKEEEERAAAEVAAAVAEIEREENDRVSEEKCKSHENEGLRGSALGIQYRVTSRVRDNLVTLNACPILLGQLENMAELECHVIPKSKSTKYRLRPIGCHQDEAAFLHMSAQMEGLE